MARKRRTARSLGDVAFVFGKDERGVHILRRRSEDGPVEAGVMAPLAEGRPITGEVISLEPRKDVPFLFDVKTVLEDPTARDASTQDQRTEDRPAEASGDGPAQVATDSYRKGWDAIWGRRGTSNLN